MLFSDEVGGTRQDEDAAGGTSEHGLDRRSVREQRLVGLALRQLADEDELGAGRQARQNTGAKDRFVDRLERADSVAATR